MNILRERYLSDKAFRDLVDEMVFLMNKRQGTFAHDEIRGATMLALITYEAHDFGRIPSSDLEIEERLQALKEGIGKE